MRASTPIATSSSSPRSLLVSVRAAKSTARFCFSPGYPALRPSPRKSPLRVAKNRDLREMSSSTRRSFPSCSTAKSPPISKAFLLTPFLDIVSPPQFRRLGFDSLVSGPAIATFGRNGDVRTIAVTSTLALTPVATSRPQEKFQPTVSSMPPTRSAMVAWTFANSNCTCPRAT